jgi:mRNA interferase YafQ
MRTIERTKKFKRDYQRVRNSGRYKTFNRYFQEVISALVYDTPLAPKCRDHKLVGGEWQGCRECHIKPDLLLVYKLIPPSVLTLVRLGSHSELGLA